MEPTLLRTFGRYWWLVLLRGLAAIAFGLMAWAWPGPTLVTLTLFWGAYALVDGIAALWSGWQAKAEGKPMWQSVLIGLLGIAAAVFTFVAPAITTAALLMLIAFWAIVNGVLQVAAAVRLRKELANEWMLILSGVLSVVFGVAMFVNPGAGAMAVLWLIGAFSIAYGVLLVVLALRLRRHAAAAAT
jgi:uncharacterized membrane protein HdeD (DUF308 family)